MMQKRSTTLLSYVQESAVTIFFAWWTTGQPSPDSNAFLHAYSLSIVTSTGSFKSSGARASPFSSAILKSSSITSASKSIPTAVSSLRGDRSRDFYWNTKEYPMQLVYNRSNDDYAFVSTARWMTRRSSRIPLEGHLESLEVLETITCDIDRRVWARSLTDSLSIRVRTFAHASTLRVRYLGRLVAYNDSKFQQTLFEAIGTLSRLESFGITM